MKNKLPSVYLLSYFFLTLVLINCSDLRKAEIKSQNECAASDCHNSTPLGHSIPLSGKHAIHLEAGYECGNCHFNYMDNPNHRNGRLETETKGLMVFFNTLAATASWEVMEGSCSNIECHYGTQISSINSRNNGLTRNTASIAYWYAESNGCTICHGQGSPIDPVATNGSGTSGKHTMHISSKGIGCIICHSNYREDPSHMNGIYGKNELDTIVSPGGSFNGIPVSFTFADSSGACDAITCHGNTGGVNWYSSGTSCTACHSSGSSIDPGTSGKHAIHLTNTGIDCEVCHKDYKTQPTHMNGTPGTAESGSIVNFSGNFIGGAVTSSYSKTSDYCTSLSCHGGLKWYATSSYACTDCHTTGTLIYPVVIDSSGTNGNHQNHSQYQCVKCHQGYYGKAEHGNGVMDAANSSVHLIEFDTLNPSGSWTGDSGSKTGSCNNLYCHSDGRTVTFGNFVLNSETLNWYGTYPDPQGDGIKCNNCHLKPPTSDSHDLHIGGRNYKCSWCHYDTTREDTLGNNNIFDKTKHANGIYDVVADNIYKSLIGTNLVLTYDFKMGGGTCSANSCHDWAHPNSSYTIIDWDYTNISATMTATVDNCSSNTVNVNIVPGNCASCVKPYEAKIEWGDEANTVFDWGSVTCSSTAPYNCTASFSYTLKKLYTIKWDIRDTNGTYMTAPHPRTQTVNVCNTPPVPQFDLVYKGSGYNFLLYDRSTDADYNTPGHSGSGEIKISWGGFPCFTSPVKGISYGMSNMTDIDPGSNPPLERQHYFQYYSGGNADVVIAVRDNSGDGWVCLKRTYFIESGNSSYSGETLYNDSTCQTFGNSTTNVNYPSSSVSYQFNSNSENWARIIDLNPLTVTGGTLRTTSTGNNPNIANTCFNYSGNNIPNIYIKMKTSCGSQGQLYWTTRTDGTYTEPKSKTFTLISDNNFQVYSLDLSGNGYWLGNDIWGLRLKPLDANGCSIEIDYIQSTAP